MSAHSIKLVLSDLDATLLKDDKSISKYTLKTIQKLREQGIKFVPATARALRVLERMNVLDRVPHDGLILLNGSRLMIEDAVLFEQGINPHELKEVLDILVSRFPHERISVEIKDTMYVNHNIWEVDPSETNYILSDFSNLPQAMASRIIIGLTSLDDYEALQACLPDYMYTHNIEGTPLCRVLHRTVSKASAIEFLCNYWGYKKDEIVCFGDDLNDLEMFAYCGTAIAMSNALEDVKKQAQDITQSNNEDGVAHWLQANLLKT